MRDVRSWAHFCFRVGVALLRMKQQELQECRCCCPLRSCLLQPARLTCDAAPESLSVPCSSSPLSPSVHFNRKLQPKISYVSSGTFNFDVLMNEACVWPFVQLIMMNINHNNHHNNNNNNNNNNTNNNNNNNNNDNNNNKNNNNDYSKNNYNNNNENDNNNSPAATPTCPCLSQATAPSNDCSGAICGLGFVV
jgi:hypothetical protein